MASLKRQNKKLSVMTGKMIPAHIRENKPAFETFIKGFFEYLEQNGNPYDIITHIFDYGDIDETADEYVKYFKSTYAGSIPDNLTEDFKFLIKNVKSFYKTKGSESAFQFLLRYLFNSESTFYYPKVDILRTSAGNWQVPTYIRPKASPALEDMNFYVDTRIRGVVTGATAYIERLYAVEDPANPPTKILNFKLVSNSISGTFQNGEDLEIIDANKDISSYVTIAVDDISSGINGLTTADGDWEGESGLLSGTNKLQDNHYYQDFSYVIVSTVSAAYYKETLKDLVHPAGYAIFGELVLSEDVAIDLNLLPNFTSQVKLETLDDNINIALSLNEVINLSLMLGEYDLFNSFVYYDANKYDPIVSTIFTPEDIWNVPISEFTDDPSLPMPYQNSDLDKQINLAFDSDYDHAYSLGTRASSRYCPVFKDIGEMRYVLIPDNEAPRHGWRQWENLVPISDAGYVDYTSKSEVSDSTTPIEGFSNSIDFLAGVSGYAYNAGGSVYGKEGETFLFSAFIQFDDELLDDPIIGLGSIGVDLSIVLYGTVVSDVMYKYEGDGIWRIGAWSTRSSSGTGNIGVVKYSFQTARSFKLTGIQVEKITSPNIVWSNYIPNSANLNGIGWSRYTNGNTVVSNVVIEAQGNLIPSSAQGEVDGYSPIVEDNLMTNGDFPINTDGWTITGTGIGTWEVVNGQVHSYGATSNSNYFWKDFACEVGQYYIVSIDVIADDGNYGGVGPYTTGGWGRTVTVWEAGWGTGTFEAVFKATQTTHYINFQQGGLGGTNIYDNVEVRLAHPTRYNYAPEPELVNQVLYPRDFSTWTAAGTPTYVLDQVGFDGLPNTAWTLGDDDNVLEEALYNAVSIDDDSNTHSTVIRVGKDADETRFVGIFMRLTGGTSVQHLEQINTKTGASITEVSGGSVAVVDDGSFWKVIISCTNNSTGNNVSRLYLYPARGGATFGTLDASATGSAIFDQAELHLNTSISTIKYASPIPDGAGTEFTKSVDVFESPILGALFPQEAGACLVNWRPAWTYSEIGIVQVGIVTIAAAEDNILYAQENYVKSYDGVATPSSTLLSYSELAPYSLASYWGDVSGVIIDSGSENESSYDGAFTSDGTLRL
ncbi:MAG: hypothetical protein KAS32_28290, partial [Candidatus Peribacteraceae bacterium]|nr:hypothetical protein [Candidatus Peribacteraceae bacterium]